MEIKGNITFCSTTGDINSDILFETIADKFLDEKDIEDVENLCPEVTAYIENSMFRFNGDARMSMMKEDDRVSIELIISNTVFTIDISDFNLVIISNDDNTNLIDRYIVVITGDTKIIIHQTTEIDL